MKIELIEDLASAALVTVNRFQVSQALREAEKEIDGEWHDVWARRLVAAGKYLNLRIDAANLSIRAVADLLRPGVVALFRRSNPTPDKNGQSLQESLSGTDHDERWLMLTGASGGAVRVLTPGEPLAARWLSENLLAQELGVGSASEPLPVAIVEAALGCQSAARDSSEGQHEASSHGANSGEHAAGGHHGLPPLRRLMQILRPERADIGVIFWYGVGISILMLAAPIAIESLVSTVAFGSLQQPLVILTLVLLVCLGFAAVLRALQTYLVEILQRRIFVRVMADLAQRLPRVSFSAYDHNHGPELVNRFFDVLTVQKVSATLLMEGVTIVLQTAIGMLVVAFYHPLLLGFDVVLLLLIAAIIFGMGRNGVRTAIQESIAKYRVAEWLEELARHPVAFKMGGGDAFAVHKADHLAKEYLLARDDHFRIVYRQIIAALLLQAMASTALLGIGGWLVINNALTLGQLVAAELILSAVVASFVKLGKHLESYYDLLAATDKLGHLLDLDLENSRTESLPLNRRGAQLRVRDVTFSYDPQHPLIGNLSFELPPNSRTGLVGPTSSGKSTLVELLFGLRLPQQGQLEIDGVDYRDLRLENLREQIAIVRRIEVFDGTILDNIRMGRDQIMFSDIRSALEAVGLWERLASLPESLNTVLQTGGAPLSTGQSLRLMLARAMVGRPRLLILDGTLDGFEQSLVDRIANAVFDATAPWTLLLITHREELLGRCAKLIRLPGPIPDGLVNHAVGLPLSPSLKPARL